MMTNIRNVFYNGDNLNKNKLRESWVQSNLPQLYEEITHFILSNRISDELKFSNKIYLYLENTSEIPLCQQCKENHKRFIGFSEGYDLFCSKKCASKSTLSIAIQKRKENTLKKWGVHHTSQLEWVKEKQKSTNLEKWGFNSPALNEQVEQRRKNTMMEKWGVEFSGQSPELLQKSIKSRFQKYRDSILENYQNLNIIDIPKEGTLIIRCQKCDSDYQIRNELLRLRYFRYKVEPCLNCNPLQSYKWTAQSDILEFISENLNGVEVIKGDRKILEGKEIDIFIPSLNLAIEFNGLWWHSELHKEKDYHLNKKIGCEEKGINLIHIWEDDWLWKKEIVKSRLLNKLGKNFRKIQARKCQIKGVPSAESKEFNDANHLQGNINASYKVGLYWQGELVSLMTFGKFRRSLGAKSSEGEWELYRFSNKLGTSVTGAFGKLLTHFEKEMKPHKVITYANRDWSSGENVYSKAGFEFRGYTGINYWYFNSDLRREHRFNFRKDKLIREGANSELSEKEIMTNSGWNVVWDCGNIKYSKEYKTNSSKTF